MGLILLLIVTVLFVARVFLYNSDSDADDKRFLMLTFVLLVLAFGCRNAVSDYGTDLNNYYRCFERAIYQDKAIFFANSIFERGYLVLNWIIARIIKWPQFIIFFQAAVCIGLTLRFIYRHSNDVFLSVLGFMSLGVMQFYLTGFRQSFAIAICLLALEAAENKKIIHFIAWIALATSIHQTAIVFLVVYFVVNIRITAFSVLIELLASIFVGRLAPLLVQIGNDTFDRNYIGAFGGNRFGGLINILIAMLPIYIIVKNRDYINSMENDTDYHQAIAIRKKSINGKLFHVLVLGTILYSLRYQALVLERTSLYFTPVLFILLPQSLQVGYSNINQRIMRIVLTLGLIFLLIWRFESWVYIPFWK